MPVNGVDSLLYVAPATSGALVDTYIPTNALVADMDENDVPVPLDCCALCSGRTTQFLYTDISRTQPNGCSIFFMSYALGIGWICQYHDNEGTAVPADASITSIAYLPL